MACRLTRYGLAIPDNGRNRGMSRKVRWIVMEVYYASIGSRECWRKEESEGEEGTKTETDRDRHASRQRQSERQADIDNRAIQTKTDRER